MTGSIIVVNGAVYTGCYYTYLCAISATTGQLLWSRNLNDWFTATPASANNLVYMNTSGGHVEALNASSGTGAWSYATGFTINDAPLTANGLVYVGATNGVLYALNGTTGKVVWNHSFPSVFSTPSIDGGQLYVSAGGSLYALNSQTGQVAWHAPGNGGTPVIASGMLYLSDTTDSKLLALNEKTGALAWSVTSASNPSVANGVIYALSSRCTLEALSASGGSVLWQFNSSLYESTCVQYTPIVANGVVYTGASDDEDPDCYCSAVVALSAATGSQVGYIEDDNGEGMDEGNPVIVVNGTLYFSAEVSVYAYSLT